MCPKIRFPKKHWKKNERFECTNWDDVISVVVRLNPRGNKPISINNLDQYCHNKSVTKNEYAHSR